MKLYNIYQDIILEEISKEQLLINEGVIEDIKKALDKPVFVRFKYQTEDGVITNRYVRLDKKGTSLAGNSVVRLWQVGGQTTKTKKNGKVVGYKLFRVDRIIPGSVELTNMSITEPVITPEQPYNATGDKLMRNVDQFANYKKIK
jgi:hypothetical protein